MRLPFLAPSQQKKIRDTLAAVKVVYNIEPRTAIAESLLFIAEAFLTMYQISVFGHFLDDTVHYVQAAGGFSLPAYLASASFVSFLKLAGLWLLINLFTAVKSYLQTRLETIYWDEMPSQVIAKMSSLNLEDVEIKEFQDLRSGIYNYAFYRILDTYWRVRQVVYEITKIFSAAFFILRINPFLALGAFLLVLPETFYKYRAKKKERAFVEGTVDQRKYADYIYNESVYLRNFSELKVDGVFRFLLDERRRVVSELNEGLTEQRYDQYIGGFVFAFIDQVFFRLLLLGLVAITVLRRLTVGTFQALFQYMVSLYESSLALWDRLSVLGDNAQYIGDYFTFDRFAGFGDVSIGNRDIEADVPEIEARHLTFSYHGWAKPIIRDADFRIKPGEKVALLGGDGSGKTTIIKLLCGLYHIKDGDILYDGISLRDLKRGELKEKISVLFEDFIKYDLSLRENIVLSAAGLTYDAELYRRVLEVTLLDTWMKETNLSDSQMLGRLFKGGVEISNGHWQRIALARTLYRNRGIFIMDEPFVYIDDATRRRILEGVLGFVGERTLIMTLHGMAEAKFFDRVLMLEDGAVRELEING